MEDLTIRSWHGKSGEQMLETIELRFVWKELQPDRRQWKPSSPMFNPVGVTVVIPVPADEKYFNNLTQLKESNSATPELTLTGMRYCIDQFENVMSDPDPEPIDIDIDFDDGNWDDNEDWE